MNIARLLMLEAETSEEHHPTDSSIAVMREAAVVIAGLLVAAEEMMAAIATRDIPSFIWGSPRAQALLAAIARAEGETP